MAWWQQLVALCVGIAAVLGLLSVLGRWAHRMWSTSRKWNRLLDQMLGDREAGLPSLMDQVGDIRDELSRQAKEQVRQGLEQQRQARVLVEHRHGPGGGMLVSGTPSANPRRRRAS